MSEENVTVVYQCESDRRVAELDRICGPIFEEFAKELNRNTIVLEQEGGGLYFVPTIKSTGNFTKANASVGAFTLDKAESGEIVDSVKRDHQKELIIIRRPISYTTASKILGNPEKARSYLLPHITEAILTLQVTKGFGSENMNAGTFYGCFKRPGTGASYFRDNENNAGYEFRLFSDSWNCIDPELKFVLKAAESQS